MANKGASPIISSAPGEEMSPPDAHPAALPPVNEEDVLALARALKEVDDSALEAVIADALRKGIAPSRILVEVAAPAARHIGHEWEEDLSDFVDVTLATGRLQRLVRSLGSAIREEVVVEEEAPTILLASPPGQSHTLGLLMVAEFFQAASWNVYLGAPFEGTATPELVARQYVHVVGLSISLTDRATQVRSEIQRIRRRSQNRKLGILVGGPAILLDPSLSESLGADGAATDARLALQLARHFL
jgi:MerR family transcriptional regulator, light-induced transcriptional regulator